MVETGCDASLGGNDDAGLSAVLTESAIVAAPLSCRVSIARSPSRPPYPGTCVSEARSSYGQTLRLSHVRLMSKVHVCTSQGGGRDVTGAWRWLNAKVGSLSRTVFANRGPGPQ